MAKMALNKFKASSPVAIKLKNSKLPARLCRVTIVGQKSTSKLTPSKTRMPKSCFKALSSQFWSKSMTKCTVLNKTRLNPITSCTSANGRTSPSHPLYATQKMTLMIKFLTSTTRMGLTLSYPNLKQSQLSSSTVLRQEICLI